MSDDISISSMVTHTQTIFIKTFSVCLSTFRFYFPYGDISLRSLHVCILPLLEMLYIASKYFGSNYEASSPTEKIQAMRSMIGIGLCPSVSHFTLTAITV